MNTEQQNDAAMQLALINLIAKVGLEAALLIIKAVNSAPTLSDAIAKLEGVQTAQQFVDADAAQRGVPARPLPKTITVP